jgi:hypothetical protein
LLRRRGPPRSASGPTCPSAHGEGEPLDCRAESLLGPKTNKTKQNETKQNKKQNKNEFKALFSNVLEQDNHYQMHAKFVRRPINEENIRHFYYLIN